MKLRSSCETNEVFSDFLYWTVVPVDTAIVAKTLGVGESNSVPCIHRVCSSIIALIITGASQPSGSKRSAISDSIVLLVMIELG